MIPPDESDALPGSDKFQPAADPPPIANDASLPAEEWQPVGVESSSHSKSLFQPELLTNVRPSILTPQSIARRPATSVPSIGSLLVSTLFSLIVVLILLVCLRFLLPPMLESSRYSWHRGQLRAEYELSGQQLERVSWEGLTQISQTVAKRVSPCVVQIQVASQEDASEESSAGGLRLPSWIQEPRGNRPPLGQGSGVIVDPRGYILTNYHVLDGGAEVTVMLADERVEQAEIIGFDRTTDLALIKIQAEDLLAIDWGDSDAMEIGSPVWAVGSPFGLTGTVSFGILSGKHRIDLNANPQYRGSRERITSRYSDLMQSDVAVNPGNSGGPLVNGRGQLIGINTAIVGESYRGVSFSIPSRVARVIFEQFMAHGRVRRGWLGVELVDEIVAEGDGAIPNVVVRAVVPDSPAQRSGVYQGDRILKCDGIPVTSVPAFIEMIRKSAADHRLVLTILRDGDELAIEVTLGELAFAP